MSRLPKETSKVDLEDEIHRPSFELVEETWNSQALLEHLLTLLQIVYGKHKTLKAEIDLGFGLIVVQQNSSVI